MNPGQPVFSSPPGAFVTPPPEGAGLPMAMPVGLLGMPPPPVPPPPPPPTLATPASDDMDMDVEMEELAPTKSPPPLSIYREKDIRDEKLEDDSIALSSRELPAATAAILAKLSQVKPPDVKPAIEKMPAMEMMPEFESGEGGGSDSPTPALPYILPVASQEVLSTLIPESGGMPLHEQFGPVTVGPGADKEAQLLGLGLPKLSRRQQEDLAAAKKFAMEQSIKHVLLRQTAAHQANQQKIAMYAQALSLMARVYIGSISFEIREETIKQTFSPFGPIKSINMSWDPITGHHKGFAFLEYDVPEAALLAQDQMTGVLLGGRNIKVSAADEGVKLAFGQQAGRPSNMPQATPVIEMIMQEAKEYHRIYVSSIHHELNEAEVKSVFEAFGKIKTCKLARVGNQSNAHRGYGYIEFHTQHSVTDAVASMNLFDLGGQNLRVGKAITPPQAQSYIVPTSTASLPTAAAIAAAAVTAKIQAMEASIGGSAVQSGGIGTAPQVLVGATPDTMGTNRSSGAVFTVPEPGLYTYEGNHPTPPSNNSPSHSNGNGNNSPGPVVPPPSIVQIPSLGADPEPFITMAQPQAALTGATFAKPKPPKKPKAMKAYKGTKIDIMSLPEAPVAGADGTTVNPYDTTGSELMLREDSMAILLGIKPKTAPHPGGAAKKKRPQGRKKLGYQKTEEELQGDKTATMLSSQQVNTSGTAQKIIAAGVLTEKQKEMLENQAGSSLASQEDIKIKGNDARNMLMHKLMRRGESRVVVLRNMVDAADVDDDLEKDIEDECSKSGTVDSVIIYQEKESEAEDAKINVKIFVKFTMPAEAETAKSSMNNRWFGGRQITCETYDQSLFDHNDLTG